MRLILDLPASWRSTSEPGLERIALDEALAVEVPELRPIPEDILYWGQQCAFRDIPGGATRIELLAKSDRKTEIGWWFAVYESVALAGDEIVEARIHFVFPMLEYGTILVARSPLPQRLAARREELFTVLGSARPDWGSDPRASIRDLFA
jgi:hypothetical protein